MRPLPQLTPENEFFWTCGEDGVLRMLPGKGPCELRLLAAILNGSQRKKLAEGKVLTNLEVQ